MSRAAPRALRGLWLLVALASGCATFDPSALPESDHLVLVKSCRLPPDVISPVDLAHHSWFDVKLGSEQDWRRIEVITTKAFTDDDVVETGRISAAEARSTERWSRGVDLHVLVEGEEAERIGRELLRLAEGYEDRRNYRGWAGPNSNTFVERLGQRVPGFRFQLDHNAVGKDYEPFLRVGATTSATGIELETYLVGFELGLEEGIQLHVLNMTIGIDLLPPALLLPFLPRLGFQDTNLLH